MQLWDLINLLPQKEVWEELIRRFHPLLKKYANLLRTEDAYSELRLFFMETLAALKKRRLRRITDDAVVSYLSKAIRNQYIVLSHKAEEKRMEVLAAELSEASLYRCFTSYSYVEDYGLWELLNGTACLTAYEQKALLLYYQVGYTITEIASMRGVSRQAVNQVKLCALKKLYDLETA